MEGFFWGILWGVILGIPSGLSSAHLLLRARGQGLTAGLLTGLGTSCGITCYGALSLALFALLQPFSQEVLFVAGTAVLLLALQRILWPQRDWAEEEVFPKAYFFPSALVVALSCPGSLAALLLGRAAGIGADRIFSLLVGVLVGSMLWNGFFAVLAILRPRLPLAAIDRGCGAVLGTAALAVSLWGAL
ncbi:MAG: hypothetical protein ACOYJZ_05080 [Acutalibacter sp.]|jgi:threonine/homoserine/homoserine lactone efflux protein